MVEPSRPLLAAFALGVLAGLLFPLFAWQSSKGSLTAAQDVFSGAHYTNPEQTVGRRLIYSGPFARLEEHTVRIDSKGNTVDDWVWIDIKDQVRDFPALPLDELQLTAALIRSTSWSKMLKAALSSLSRPSTGLMASV